MAVVFAFVLTGAGRICIENCFCYAESEAANIAEKAS